MMILEQLRENRFKVIEAIVLNLCGDCREQLQIFQFDNHLSLGLPVDCESRCMDKVKTLARLVFSMELISVD